MEFVIDTNRIIASLIKDGISRKILLNEKFNFITPDYTISEILKYKNEVINKAKITNKEFELLLSILFEKIRIIPKLEYKNSIKESINLIKDIKDIPFMALAISSKADGIWSDDTDFKTQNKIKIFTTKDMIQII